MKTRQTCFLILLLTHSSKHTKPLLYVPNSTGLLGNSFPGKACGSVTGWRVLPAFPSVQESEHKHRERLSVVQLRLLYQPQTQHLVSPQLSHIVVDCHQHQLFTTTENRQVIVVVVVAVGQQSVASEPVCVIWEPLAIAPLNLRPTLFKSGLFHSYS